MYRLASELEVVTKQMFDADLHSEAKLHLPQRTETVTRHIEACKSLMFKEFEDKLGRFSKYSSVKKVKADLLAYATVQSDRLSDENRLRIGKLLDEPEVHALVELQQFARVCKNMTLTSRLLTSLECSKISSFTSILPSAQGTATAYLTILYPSAYHPTYIHINVYAFSCIHTRIHRKSQKDFHCSNKESSTA